MRVNKPIHILSVSIGIFLAELLLISLLVDAKLLSDEGWLGVFSYLGLALRWFIVFLTLLGLSLILTRPHNQFSLEQAVKSIQIKRYLTHFIVFMLFTGLTVSLFQPDAILTPLQGLSWLALALLVFLTWLSATLRYQYTTRFLVQIWRQLLICAFLAVLILTIVINSRWLWQPLSQFTLTSSAALLEIFFEWVIIHQERKLLGINDFIVEISPQCSGLEGLFIALSVTGIYLYLLRSQLKFPIALLLLPISAVMAILFNVVRVTVLIIIGGTYSPELAVGGFHSIAGWLFAVATAFMVIFVFSNWLMFSRSQAATQDVTQAGDHTASDPSGSLNSYHDQTLASAILIPFIFLLLIAMTSSMFNTGFDTLYPLKIMVAGGLLVYFWKKYQLKWPSNLHLSISVGLVVGIIWVVLVPNNAQYNQQFIEGLFSLSSSYFIFWLLLRTVGFLFVAPVLEELVFRGYLIARIANRPIQPNQIESIHWLGLILSAIAFGIMHNALIAGVVAGILFGWVRFKSNNLAGPIIAHFIANLTVGIWALVTARWVLI